MYLLQIRLCIWPWAPTEDWVWLNSFKYFQFLVNLIAKKTFFQSSPVEWRSPSPFWSYQRLKTIMRLRSSPDFARWFVQISSNAPVLVGTTKNDLRQSSIAINKGGVGNMVDHGSTFRLRPVTRKDNGSDLSDAVNAFVASPERRSFDQSASRCLVVSIALTSALPKWSAQMLINTPRFLTSHQICGTI